MSTFIGWACLFVVAVVVIFETFPVGWAAWWTAGLVIGIGNILMGLKEGK